MHLHLMKRDSETGELFVDNIIVVDDPETFVRDAKAYLATFDLVVLKDRDHQPGDPGVGWKFDEKREVFTAPKAPQEVAIGVTAETLNDVPLDQIVTYKTETGIKVAKKIDEDTFLVQQVGKKFEIFKVEDLHADIVARKVEEAVVEVAVDALIVDKARQEFVKVTYEEAKAERAEREDVEREKRERAEDIAAAVAIVLEGVRQ